MLLNKAPYRVLLPDWIWDKDPPETKEELAGRIKRYMERYPHYRVIELDGRFAVCERVEES